jgi:hypothetical protein
MTVEHRLLAFGEDEEGNDGPQRDDASEDDARADGGEADDCELDDGSNGQSSTSAPGIPAKGETHELPLLSPEGSVWAAPNKGTYLH